jgi:hypothetical protein
MAWRDMSIAQEALDIPKKKARADYLEDMKFADPYLRAKEACNTASTALSIAIKDKGGPLAELWDTGKCRYQQLSDAARVSIYFRRQ